MPLGGTGIGYNLLVNVLQAIKFQLRRLKGQQFSIKEQALDAIGDRIWENIFEDGFGGDYFFFDLEASLCIRSAVNSVPLQYHPLAFHDIPVAVVQKLRSAFLILA